MPKKTKSDRIYLSICGFNKQGYFSIAKKDFRQFLDTIYNTHIVDDKLLRPITSWRGIHAHAKDSFHFYQLTFEDVFSVACSLYGLFRNHLYLSELDIETWEENLEFINLDMFGDYYLYEDIEPDFTDNYICDGGGKLNASMEDNMRHKETYCSWDKMKQRCLNPNNHKYKDYGGRGVTICEKWLTYSGFLEDMGERPNGTTLDRINVNGNYTKENCRWATGSEQMRNRRPRGKSKVLGVYTHGDRWRTYITVNGKQILIGCFDTIDEACEARKRAEKEVGYS